MLKRKVYAKRIVIALMVFLLSVLVLATVADLWRNSKFQMHPLQPKSNIPKSENKIYSQLVNGDENMNWQELDGTLSYIKAEYDCSDFRLINLIRILYQFEDKVPPNVKQKIKNVLFDFRYWMDEPGENSMCYWSENHQILFASAEYLIAQRYPNATFTNDGLASVQHKEKVKQRILDWLQLRWDYGFSEFYSSVYYKEDVAALLNLIDFAEDEEVRAKSEIILNLLFYDVATQKLGNMFTSVSGRAYERNRKGGKACSFDGLIDFLWSDSTYLKSALMYGFKNTSYKLPKLLKAIGNDTSEVILKQCNGLDLSELISDGFVDVSDKFIMMQWGMEAFVNPEVVRNSLAYIRENRMFSNAFLSDFKYLNIALFRWLHLEPQIMRWLKLQVQGTTIQKGNTYTYKTKDYSLYTAQNHHPGMFADQHHIFGLNIKNHFAVYHTHPKAEKGNKGFTIGYGVLPHSVQHKNVNLSIYQITKKKRFQYFTYAYFPIHKFDSVQVKENYAFGMKGDTYCAFIGKNDFEIMDSDSSELIQKGNVVYWVTEAGSKEIDGSFKAFINRVKSNEVLYNKDNNTLEYFTINTKIRLNFMGDFKVNDEEVSTTYKRFDSKYIQADRKANHLQFNHKGDSLYMEFKKHKTDQ